jgi:tRNA A-37 threonylcarbamoyl transferase component Bud32
MKKNKLSSHTILEVLNNKHQWTRLGKARKRQKCLCENHELDNRFIIKQFSFDNKHRPKINWWQLEDNALSLLSGELGCPKSYGFIEENHEHKRCVYLVREKIIGKTLKEIGQKVLTEKQSAETGVLLAQLHNRNIVTRDCHLENLLLTEKNTLSFIDFGKARHYKRQSTLFYFQAGWDCWKSMWRCNKLDKNLCSLMMDSYWQTLNTTTYSKFMYKAMQKISSTHQRLRLLKQKTFKKNR